MRATTSAVTEVWCPIRPRRATSWRLHWGAGSNRTSCHPNPDASVPLPARRARRPAMAAPSTATPRLSSGRGDPTLPLAGQGRREHQCPERLRLRGRPHHRRPRGPPPPAGPCRSVRAAHHWAAPSHTSITVIAPVVTHHKPRRRGHVTRQRPRANRVQTTTKVPSGAGPVHHPRPPRQLRQPENHHPGGRQRVEPRQAGRRSAMYAPAVHGLATSRLASRVYTRTVDVAGVQPGHPSPRTCLPPATGARVLRPWSLPPSREPGEAHHSPASTS